MATQIIEIRDEPFALLPKREYQELVARAEGVTLPVVPPPNPRGNLPAKSVMRAVVARDLITDRLTVGWSQDDLAQRAGVSVETVRRLESGAHSPSVSALEKIDRVLREAAGVE